VPMDSATVSEAVFKSLFDRATDAEQLSLLELLDEQESAMEQVHKSWDRAIERETINRTRFAQRAIKPEEVAQELVESDRVLGNESDIERFVLTTCARLNHSLVKQKQGWRLQNIPTCVKPILGDKPRRLTFTTPPPEGVEYVGRNHPLVEGLARYVLEDALENGQNPVAARCGFTVTTAVEKRTTLLMLRLRHLLASTKGQDLLAEECLVAGFTGPPSAPLWLEPEAAAQLLQQAEPTGDIPLAMKRLEIEELLGRLEGLQEELNDLAQQRANALLQSHRRVRAITKEGQIRVKPQLPMDILGVFVLQPG